MNIRKVVSLVVLEYVARESNIPTIIVTEKHINEYLHNLQNNYADFIQCIFYDLCGHEAEDVAAQKTIYYWLVLTHP